MNLSMLGDRKNPKVGGGIVLSIPIEVVDHMPFRNFGSKVMQDQPMFQDISMSMGERMIRGINRYVPIGGDEASPFPTIGVGAGIILRPHMMATKELRDVSPPLGRLHDFPAPTMARNVSQGAAGDSSVVSMYVLGWITSEMPATIRSLHDRSFLTATAHAQSVRVRNVVGTGGLSWRCHDCPHDTAMAHHCQGGKGR